MLVNNAHFTIRRSTTVNSTRNIYNISAIVASAVHHAELHKKHKRMILYHLGYVLVDQKLPQHRVIYLLQPVYKLFHHAWYCAE